MYYNFDRQILAKTETTEGTATSPAAVDFIDTLTDISMEFTPTMNERPLVRPGLTEVPDLASSSGLTGGTMVGTATLSFSVEMSLKSGGTPITAAPQWGTLLKACGFSETTGVKRCGTGGTITGGPLLNREMLVVSSVNEAQLLGTTFTGDSFAYYDIVGTGITSADAVSGAVSSGAFTASSSDVAVGIGYLPDTAKGYGDGSSCTLQLYRAGRLYTLKGCRGNVSFQFNSGDRVIAAFTMEGVMHSVINGSKKTGIAISHALPTTFEGANLRLNEHGAESTAFTGAFFENLTLDMGNEIVLRSDANSASGYKAAQITGRKPTVQLNPDAVVGGITSSTVFDFMEKWIKATVCRAEWYAGSTTLAGTSMLFRTPALVFDGAAIADRDKVEIADVTAKVTGGLYGDSVVASSGTARYHDDRGMDNELSIILF